MVNMGNNAKIPNITRVQFFKELAVNFFFVPRGLKATKDQASKEKLTVEKVLALSKGRVRRRFLNIFN